MLKLTTTLFLALLGSVAHGQILSGRDLLKACRTHDERAHCDAYIAGVSDGAAATMQYYVDDLHQRPVVCPPAGINNSQILPIARQFLEDNPGKLDQQAAVLIIGSLMTAFPCHNAK